MVFCKKVKITLIFLFGLFLFSFNQVYAVDYTASTTYGNFKFYIPDNVLEYVYSTPEYSQSGTDYGWFVILNSNTNKYELYFTPWSSGTPIQAYLTYNRWHFNGTFNYIKYESSDGNNWTRSTGTISNQDLYVYKDSDNQFYSWSWDYSIYFYFIQNNGGWISFPMPILFNPPDINNWTTNDSTTPMTFTSVDDTAYIVVHRNSISLDSTMILNCYDVTNGTNLVQEFELNGNSPFLSSDKTQYTIGLYVSNWFHTVTGNKYLFTLTYLDSSNNSNTLSYWFDLSYDTATQENINNNEQQSINNELNKTNEYLTNNNVDYNNVMNQFQDFEVRFSNPNDNYADNLFEILNQMFVSDTVHDFVFTFPFSNGENSITVPANYIETHIPEILLVMIRIFYWYVISRYIIKDIWKVIDKLRQGDYFLTNDKDIKTEIL